jgi:DNA polymerase
MKQVEIAPVFDDWRLAARALLAAGVRPEDVVWVEAADRVEAATETVQTGSPPVSVPRGFIEIATRVARHADRSRWDLLYRILWRLVHDDRNLLGRDADPDVSRLRAMERDLTPAVGGTTLQPGGTTLQGRPAQGGLLDELRSKPGTAAAFFPPERSIAALRDAAAACTACPLYKTATQTVFGAGPSHARAMFVGEQPGDQEDLAGKPFVGPAGDVLTRALADAGIPRDEVYITNAVKHFKWEPRGKRRIHQTPRAPELDACRPWLEAEIDALKPVALVCLGATAAQTLMGPQFRIMRDRGVVFRTRWAPWLMATIHPSAILRVDEPAAQERAYAELVADLRKVAARLEEERAVRRE